MSNTPRIKQLKKKTKRKKNRVTVDKLIQACLAPMSFNNPTKALDEFLSMKFAWNRAAQVAFIAASLQKYVDAGIAALNKAKTEEEKNKVARSTLVLNFQPFNMDGLFLDGPMISAKALIQLQPWLIKGAPKASLPSEDNLKIEEAPDEDDPDEEDDPDAPVPIKVVPEQ